jgi:hypothetical protein
MDSAAATKDDGAEEPPHHEADSEPVSDKGSKRAKSEPTGVLDKEIKIKGTGVTIRFGGFAKVDFMQDLDPIGNPDQFKVNSIPVEGDPDAELGGSTNISAKQTRLSVDVRGDTSTGQVRGYVEGDFFGDSSAFRLRHGYGEWKGLLGGQTWTTFQDITARPFTLDYEGPDSEFFVRQPMIRYTGRPSETLEWSAAVEDPDSEITVPTGVSGSGRSEFPDIPARVRIKPAWGHIQVAGILRQLRFVSDGGVIDETTTGYGLNLSGKAKVLKHDTIMGHVGFGAGIGRYIESFTGSNSDAVLTPAGDLEAIDAFAFVLGYTHHWNDRLSSTLSGGVAELDNEPSQPDDAIKSARSPHLHLVYAPNRLLNIGGEVMWGERENKDGAKGDAVRLQVSIQYKFR